MKREEIISKIRERKSFLCVGLDPDLGKFPEHLRNTNDPVFAFNKEIIDQTSDLCVSYKLNLAFFEQLGIEGMQAFQRTVEYIGSDHFIIADAKRGDIGNTSSMYARAFFETFGTDAITLSPYMGEDSIRPFLEFEDKWSIVLALTSNKGSADFQHISENGEALYESVLRKVSGWGHASNTMFVVGATNEDQFRRVREIVPDHFLLVPGVGAQGGSLEAVCQHGLNSDIGLLVNSSRGIIYAGRDQDFGDKARMAAQSLQGEMQAILEDRSLI